MFKKSKPANQLDTDIRFLLANERTLLAWVRTGLTLIAGGVAIAFIAADDTQHANTAGLGAILFGGLLACIGYVRYRVADMAIRSGNLPPTGVSGLLVVVAVVVFAAALVLSQNFSS